MKKAIVLLMTIGFITVISALVVIAVSISQKRFNEVAFLEAQNQFSVVFKDFVTMLNNNVKQVTKNEHLEMLLLYSMPPLKEPETGVEVGFLIESQMGKLNLNYLLDQVVKDPDDNGSLAIKPIVNYFALYELKEPQTMMDLLLDTIDADDMERSGYTELVSENFDFRQGRIYSFKHLKKLFDRYYQLSKDPNVYQINRESFEDIFYYGDANKTKQLLDCNELYTGTVVALMTDNYYEGNEFAEFCDEANRSGTVLNNLKDIYNISSFEDSNQYLIKCDLIFNTDTYKRNITFEYDIKSKRIDNIDTLAQE